MSPQKVTWEWHLNSSQDSCNLISTTPLTAQRCIPQIPPFPGHTSLNAELILYSTSLLLHMGEFSKSRTTYAKFLPGYMSRWTCKARRRRQVPPLGRNTAATGSDPRHYLFPRLSLHFMWQQEIQQSIVWKLKCSPEYIHLHTFHSLDRSLGKDKTIANDTLQTQQI